MKATWKLKETDVRLSRHLPTKASFIANLYECTNCHNIANDRNGLPDVCPWCRADMTDVVISKEDATKMMPSLGIVFDAMDSNTRGILYITDSFENVMATIQAASDGQYDKLSQTVVIKNK